MRSRRYWRSRLRRCHHAPQDRLPGVRRWGKEVGGNSGVRIAILTMTAQQVAGADLAIENPSEADLAFAALQAKFDYTAPAARRLSSCRWAAWSKWSIYCNYRTRYYMLGGYA